LEELSNDKISGLLISNLDKLVKVFYADEIDLVMRSGEEDAPGLDEIIDQVSTGQIGYGGVEYTQFKTELEQAKQGLRRAEKFVEHVSSEVERWVSEHAGFLRDLIKEQRAESRLAGDAERVRKLAGLLEKKQDAFPPLLLAIYALGAGWDRIFIEK
jgi:hypothetical protein